MVSRPNPKDVEDLRKTILKVRKWWKSGPSLAGFFAEVWAAATFNLGEPPDNKANLPYDAKDARGRKIGIKGRAETPYTKRTGRGLSYFGFRARELDECDAFYLIAFDEKLVAKMCVEAPAHIVADYAEGGGQETTHLHATEVRAIPSAATREGADSWEQGCCPMETVRPRYTFHLARSGAADQTALTEQSHGQAVLGSRSSSRPFSGRPPETIC